MGKMSVRLWWTGRRTRFRTRSRWWGSWWSGWPAGRGGCCVWKVQRQGGRKEGVGGVRSRPVSDLTNVALVPLFAFLLLVLQPPMVAFDPWCLALLPRDMMRDLSWRFCLLPLLSDMSDLPWWPLEFVQLPLVALGSRGQVRGGVLHLRDIVIHIIIMIIILIIVIIIIVVIIIIIHLVVAAGDLVLAGRAEQELCHLRIKKMRTKLIIEDSSESSTLTLGRIRRPYPSLFAF